MREAAVDLMIQRATRVAAWIPVNKCTCKKQCRCKRLFEKHRIWYLVERNMAQVGMVRLVPVRKMRYISSELDQFEGYLVGHEHQNWINLKIIPGGHEEKSKTVDELHSSQCVHPHVHQHAI